MKFRLKATALALFAVFALSAVAAQGAMATEHTFVFAEERTILTGHGVNHVMSWGGIPISCETAQFGGTVAGNAEGESDHITLHPYYSSDCTVVGTGVEMAVHTKGCAYTFDSDTTATSHGEDAPVTIVCEAEHEITTTAPACTIHIPPQTVHGVSYQNEGNDISIAMTITGLTYTVTEEGFCFLLGLEGGEHHDGTYEGTATVKGYVDEGVHGNTTDGLTGLTFTEGSQVAIGVTTP